MAIERQIADDTIAAISTPSGRGGIGIVRLSGVDAKDIAEGIVRLKRPLEAGRVKFGHVVDPESDAVLDEAVVTYFAAPQSYTGEDVVEIAVHGSPVLLNALVRCCVAAGARLARPGEFTERAFLGGRIDLTQAEAVDDLIQATTLEQARTAARQMRGGLSRQIRPAKEKLVELIAGMEAGIDFAEDDLEVMGSAEIRNRLREMEAPLVEMQESFAYGRVLREGFKLAIVGRPNAGKSSLFNRLIRRDRAIVTAQPGTTRDPVTERLELAGIPVEMVDTAGLRETGASGESLDEAEAIGVAKTREAMAEADVVLLVVAADEVERNGGLRDEDREVIEDFAGGSSAELVVVRNKMDLTRAEELRGDGGGHGWGEVRRLEGSDGVGGMASLGVLRLRAVRCAQNDAFWRRAAEGGLVVVQTSAVNGTGIDELRAAVLRKLGAIAPGADTAPLTNMRQHGVIRDAVRAMQAAMAGVEREVPHEMVLIDLHEALGALDELTGTTHTEEILGLIFSRFCIGK